MEFDPCLRYENETPPFLLFLSGHLVGLIFAGIVHFLVWPHISRHLMLPANMLNPLSVTRQMDDQVNEKTVSVQGPIKLEQTKSKENAKYDSISTILCCFNFVKLIFNFPFTSSRELLASRMPSDTLERIDMKFLHLTNEDPGLPPLNSRDHVPRAKKPKVLFKELSKV
jgi:hypothetical protein